MFDLTRSLHAHHAALGAGAIKLAVKAMQDWTPPSREAEDAVWANLRQLSGRTLASHQAAKGDV